MKIFLFLCFLIAAAYGQPGDVCSETIVLTELQGRLTSPNYPNPYPNQILCFWTILLPEDYLVVLRFLDFDIENARGCAYDRVFIFDGPSTFDPLYLGRSYCGQNSPRPFLSTTNAVTIVFLSNLIVAEKGFEIEWSSELQCAENEFRCWDGNCIPYEQKCDGIRHCTDDSDEIECDIFSNYSECGGQTFSPVFSWHQRIIGGNRVVPNSWPWQVMLVTMQNPTAIFCGGTIISDTLVMTAAQCFNSFDGDLTSNNVIVVAGRNFLGGLEFEDGEQYRLAVKISIFSGYNSLYRDNDIALIEVSPFIFNDYVRAACIPSEGSDINITDSTCVATGWGGSRQTESLISGTLQQVVMEAQNQNICENSFYDSFGTIRDYSDSLICAGREDGGVATCSVDAGGPLVCFVDQERWVQVGITTSDQSYCPEDKTLSFFTSVKSFSSWIDLYFGPASNTTSECTRRFLFGSTGSIASPNYPNNYPNNVRCRWDISAPDGYSIYVAFEVFELERTLSCEFDYLEVSDDGVSTERVCRPVPFVSTFSNRMTLKFVSDNRVSAQGFIGTWRFTNSNCNSGTFTNTNGTIISPSYPGYYPNSYDCMWTISLPEDLLVIVRFTDFNIEDSPSCVNDYIEIFDGPSTNDTSYLNRRLCGPAAPRPFVSTNSSVVIVFHSDEVISMTGFVIKWDSESKCTNRSNFRCWNGDCIPYEQKCDGTRHCTDDSDEIGCEIESPNFEQCGTQTFQPQFIWHQRIVGGNEAVLNSWPWQIAITSQPPFPSFICGGTIIAESWVLTSAQCVSNIGRRNYIQVIAGKHSFLETESNEQTRIVDNVFIHPNFSRTALIDNVAVLHLDQPLVFNDYVRAVCISSTDSESNATESTCVTTGWGSTKNGERMSTELRQAVFEVQNRTICENEFAEFSHRPFPTEHFCAGRLSGGVGICDRDGGSPLVCFVNESMWVQTGISNYANPLGCDQGVSFFTSVASYADWIEEQQQSITNCGIIELTALTGNISSPNYPENYPPNYVCQWRITLPQDRLVVIRFLDFVLEENLICNYDSVEVFDGNSTSSQTVFDRKHCNMIPPRPFVSTTNSITIVFRSDNYISLKGFLLEWSSELICAENEFRCWDGNCIPYEQKCDGIRHCTDDSDEIECGNPTSFEQCGTQSFTPQFKWNRDLNIQTGNNNRKFVSLKKSTVSPHHRIIGGSEVIPNSWPWQIVLVLKNNPYVLRCGGSIINRRFVVTAAHCVDGLQASDLQVYAGKHDYSVVEANEQIRDVEKIAQDLYYDVLGNLNNDFALLLVNESFIFNEYVQPVCVPAPGATPDFYENSTCVATGWGVTKKFSDAALQLRQVVLDVPSRSICSGSFDLIIGGSTLHDSQICAGSVEGGDGGCNGDSGGPLVCFVNETQWVVVGLVSFGYIADCGLPYYLSFFTNVLSYTQLLQDSSSVSNTPYECFPTTLTDHSGVITSPNFPNGYPNNARCRWQIIAPENVVINIQFTDFEVELSENCIGDYFTVYDGMYNSETFCGGILPVVSPLTNNVTMDFATDNSIVYFGFRAYYSFQEIPTTAIPSTTQMTSTIEYEALNNTTSTTPILSTTPIQMTTTDVDEALNYTTTTTIPLNITQMTSSQGEEVTQTNFTSTTTAVSSTSQMENITGITQGNTTSASTDIPSTAPMESSLGAEMTTSSAHHHPVMDFGAFIAIAMLCLHFLIL